MKIETQHYAVAPLQDQTEAVQLIRQTETQLQALTGRPLTLIAYAETDKEEAK